MPPPPLLCEFSPILPRTSASRHASQLHCFGDWTLLVCRCQPAIMASRKVNRRQSRTISVGGGSKFLSVTRCISSASLGSVGRLSDLTTHAWQSLLKLTGSVAPTAEMAPNCSDWRQENSLHKNCTKNNNLRRPMPPKRRNARENAAVRCLRGNLRRPPSHGGVSRRRT